MLQELLGKAQTTIDAMREKRYVNLRQWTAKVNERVEAKLLVRLQHAISNWTKALSRMNRVKRPEWDADDEDVDQLPTIQRSVHELQLHAQTMTLSPPAEQARTDLFRQLQEQVNIVTNQKRLRAFPPPAAEAQSLALTSSSVTFTSLLRRLPNDSADLWEAYRLVESQMASVNQYIASWFQYQSLWDVQVDTIYAKMRDNFGKWQTLLTDIRRSRQMIDTAETVKHFGSVDIDYTQVRTGLVMDRGRILSPIHTGPCCTFPLVLGASSSGAEIRRYQPRFTGSLCRLAWLGHQSLLH